MTLDNDVATVRDAKEAAVSARLRKVPGESGIWVFLMGDMLVFAAMFFIYGLTRAENRNMFDTSQRMINPVYGLVYTLLLLASSWAVVMAVTAARKGLIDLASRLVVWGFAGGAAFVAIKFVEYGGKLAAGITPETNQFFTLYFVLTFVHLLHASLGLGVLMYVRSQVKALGSNAFDDADRRDRFRMIEVGGVYWHMVDLLWIMLFALFYLRG
ncbi:cytochrome c oxidase subunit 3 [Mycobacterium sp.]|uniref:cytochrome c oxidase subunit 3 n=1 Tax=Mycobacterium sp. TaxID=1785 RepID=UPI003D13127A